MAEQTDIDNTILREKAILTYLFHAYCHRFHVEVEKDEVYNEINKLKLKNGLSQNIRELYTSIIELWGRLSTEDRLIYGTKDPIYKIMSKQITRVEGTKEKEVARSVKQQIDSVIIELQNERLDRGEPKEQRDDLLSRVVHRIEEEERRSGNLPQNSEDQKDQKDSKPNYRNRKNGRNKLKTSKATIKDTESVSSVSEDESTIGDQLKAAKQEINILKSQNEQMKSNSISNAGPQPNHYSANNNRQGTIDKHGRASEYQKSCKHCNRDCAENSCSLVAGSDSLYSREGEIDGAKIAEEAYNTVDPGVTFNRITDGIKASARVRKWKSDSDENAKRKMDKFEKDMQQWKRIFTLLAPKRK
jgi:hypothetical protein